MLLIIIIATTLSISYAQVEPNLNCDVTPNWYSKQVCKDDSLAEQNAELNRVYQKFLLLAHENGLELERMFQEQKRWSKHSSKCKSKDRPKVCLKDYLSNRIAELKEDTHLGYWVIRGAQGGTASLSKQTTALPISWQFVAAGSQAIQERIAYFDSKSYPECVGYISAHPDHELILIDDMSILVNVESKGDTTLFIIRQEGNNYSFFCDDDSSSFHPSINLYQAGRYWVHVGTYFKNDKVPYTLHIENAE